MRHPRPLRLDIYVRVSQTRGRVGDSFISPAVQRDRAEQWIRAFGHECGQVFEELDESGARADRPKLLEAIERVEAGQSDGIVVAKLDRFGRTLVDGIRLVERLQAAGGTFVSVADGFDLTTETGRLVLRIMLSLAEFELDRIRGNWNDAKARAVARGIHPSAVPPFGYRREGGRGPLIPDPVTAPLVTSLFERRAAGVGYAELGRYLAAQGARTVHGGSNWPQRAVKDIVRNEVYLGVAYARTRDPATGKVIAEGFRNDDAHAPLTDVDTWKRAQRVATRWEPRGLDPHPLTAVLRCAGCRYSMRPARRSLKDGTIVTDFSCKTAHSAAHACPAPARIMDHGDLTQLVVSRFLSALPELAAEATKASPQLAAAEREANIARTTFEQWRDDARVQEQLGLDQYLAGLQARQERLNEKVVALSREQATAQAIPLPPNASSIAARWDELSVGHQRDLLGAAIRCVFVRRSSRSTPLDERVRVVFRGEAVDLPRRGAKDWRPVPFDFGRDSDRPGVGV